MKKKLFIMFVSVFTIGAISAGYQYSKDSTALKIGNVLNNVEALANGEGGGSNKVSYDCESCLNTEGGRGVRFYCTDGSGGCLDTSCVSGSCG